MNGTNTHVKSIKVVGDDTGHYHIAPHHTLELIEVCFTNIFIGKEREITLKCYPIFYQLHSFVYCKVIIGIICL